MDNLTIVLLYILVFLLFFLLFSFRWIIRTIRYISRPQNQGGYIKLIQIFLIALLVSIFILIVIYYILNPNIQVERIDVILTVVVGWLGAIIGRFFGERAMENLDEKRKINVEKLNLMVDKYDLMIEKLKKK